MLGGVRNLSLTRSKNNSKKKSSSLRGRCKKCFSPHFCCIARLWCLGILHLGRMFKKFIKLSILKSFLKDKSGIFKNIWPGTRPFGRLQNRKFSSHLTVSRWRTPAPLPCIPRGIFIPSPNLLFLYCWAAEEKNLPAYRNMPSISLLWKKGVRL